MSVFKRFSGVNKNKSQDSDHSLMRRVIALFLVLFACCGLITEVLMFGMYVLPTICVKLFQITGIQIQSGLLIKDFSLQDFCVMFMMWIVPCVFVIGISIYVHCKWIKRVMRKVFLWCKVLFKKI